MNSVTKETKITEHLKANLIKCLLALFFGGIGYIVTQLGEEASKPFLENVVPLISKELMLWMILLLFLVVLLLGIWLVSTLTGNKSEKIKKRYNFDEERGFYLHKKDGKRKICSSCVEQGIESPLMNVGFNRNLWWICMQKSCKSHYPKTKHDEC